MGAGYVYAVVRRQYNIVENDKGEVEEVLLPMDFADDVIVCGDSDEAYNFLRETVADFVFDRVDLPDEAYTKVYDALKERVTYSVEKLGSLILLP